MREVDRPMSRKNISQDSGKESDRERSVGDLSFEQCLFCIDLVCVDGIKVSYHPGEVIYHLFCNRLRDLGRISDFQFMNRFPFGHKAKFLS